MVDVRRQKKRSAVSKSPGRFTGTPREEVRYEMYLMRMRDKGKPPMNKADYLFHRRANRDWESRTSER